MPGWSKHASFFFWRPRLGVDKLRKNEPSDRKFFGPSSDPFSDHLHTHSRPIWDHFRTIIRASSDHFWTYFLGISNHFGPFSPERTCCLLLLCLVGEYCTPKWESHRFLLPPPSLLEQRPSWNSRNLPRLPFSPPHQIPRPAWSRRKKDDIPGCWQIAWVGRAGKVLDWPGQTLEASMWNKSIALCYFHSVSYHWD